MSRRSPPARVGPALRTDVVDVYVFRTRKTAGGRARYEFLQLLRADQPMLGTWHPVMGHCKPKETAITTARRELAEEVGLRAGDAAFLGFWALEQVHPFYIPRLDVVVLSPRFAVRVTPDWVPRLNDEHTEWRWVSGERARASFVWPGQRASVAEIVTSLLAPRSINRELLRIPIEGSVGRRRRRRTD